MDLPKARPSNAYPLSRKTSRLLKQLNRRGNSPPLDSTSPNGENSKNCHLYMVSTTPNTPHPRIYGRFASRFEGFERFERFEADCGQTSPRVIDRNFSFKNSSSVMSSLTFEILPWTSRVRKLNGPRSRNSSNTSPTIAMSYNQACTARSLIWYNPHPSPAPSHRTLSVLFSSRSPLSLIFALGFGGEIDAIVCDKLIPTDSSAFKSHWRRL